MGERESARASERESERERERGGRGDGRGQVNDWAQSREPAPGPSPVMTHRLFKPRVRQLQKRPTSAQYLARDACLGIQPSAAQSTKHLQPTPRLDPTQPSLWPVAPSVSGTTHGPSARYTDPSIGDNSVMLVAVQEDIGLSETGHRVARSRGFAGIACKPHGRSGCCCRPRMKPATQPRVHEHTPR